METQANYKLAIATADDFFKKAQYDQAKASYQKALCLIPADAYASTQVNKVDMIVSDQLKKLNDQKSKQEAYDKAIVDAEKYKVIKNYDLAKTSFQKAAAIFPEKPYPTQKIAEIDKAQQGLKLDADYNKLLDEANKLYAAKSYDHARDKFKAAQALKPKEPLPGQKVTEIEKILAQLDADNKKKEENERNYNVSLEKANALFDQGKYDLAKPEYEKALALIPGEEFPKQRLARILEIKNMLAKEAAKPKPQVNAKTAPIAPGALQDLKFANENERELYLKSLLAKYPPGITCETYKEKYRIITRYVIIRENNANDFRKVQFSWG